MEILDPAVKRVWTIKGLLGWGAVLPVTLTVDIILFFSNNNFFPPGLWTGILLVLSLSWILVIPRLRYHYWRYELRDKDLCAIRGIYTN